MYVKCFLSRSHCGTEEWPRSLDMVLSITTHSDEGRKAAVEEDRVRRAVVWLVGLRIFNLYDTAQSVDHTCAVKCRSVPCQGDEDTSTRLHGNLRSGGGHH